MGPWDPTKDYEGGYGLAKIAAKHPEVLDGLQEILSSTELVDETTTWKVLQSEKRKAIVRLDWNGKSKTWLVSAFELGLAPSTRTSDVGALKGGATALPTPRGGLTESVVQAKSEEKAGPGKKPAKPLDDVGEKIEGARKDLLAARGQEDLFAAKPDKAEKAAELEAKPGRATLETGEKQEQPETPAPAILHDDETHYHLPLDRGNDQDRGAARGPAGLRDLPAASRVQGRTAIYLPGGIARGAGPGLLKRRVKQVATGWFRSGLTRVTSPEEVAHLTAPLRKEAQERLLAVVTGRAGKLLAVIRHTVGQTAATQAEPHILLGSVHSVKGATKVWFVHNHPSGNPKQSGADHSITDTLGANLNGTGIESQGMIVVSPGGRASLYDAKGEREIMIKPGRRTQAIPVTERRFRRFTQGGAAPITSPSAMREIMRDQDGDGILLLDNKLVPVGWVKMSAEDMRTLRTGKKGRGASALYAALHETNANSLAVKVGMASDLGAAQNVGAFAADNQMRMVEILYGEDG